MSVLIKGMEMPTKRNGAVLIIYHDGKCAFEDGTEYKAEQLPLHGRLIDADALGITLEKLAADKWNQEAAPVSWAYAFEECLEMVDNAPTIIEQNFIEAEEDE